MAQLALHLFGTPRFECNGKPIAVGSRKAMALLAYLATSQPSHSREALLNFLWPETDPDKARAALRNTLWMLKKTPLGEWLIVDRETISLDLSAEVEVDVLCFRALSAQAKSVTDCNAVIEPLGKAADLYQDGFLAGFTLHDSPNFDEWQFFETEQLQSELSTILEKLINCYKRLGEFDAAIDYARRWLALDSMHEPTHRILMELYAQSGQRSAAVRQYEICARILDEELGVPPDSETTDFYERICHDQQPVILPTPTTTEIIHNLPAQITPFVGRDVELAELSRFLSDGELRFITILGPGGMGKTRLALELAQTQLHTFPDGVFFISLAPLDRVDAIIPAIAEALTFSFHDEGTPKQQLFDYLHQKTMLLILDNCEHLLSGMDLAVELLQFAPHIRIIATSRERLKLQGEQLFQIGGIDFPDWETPEDALEYSAVKLFMQSACRVQPNFELSEDDLTYVARICRLAQGMPLGILLAAAWVELLSPAEIAAELAHSLDILESNFRDMPERHQSMRAVFDQSWRLLNEPERETFQRLSVFRGGCTRAAAQTVTGASLRLLMSLVNKSLLHRTAANRFEVHELLRQYAAEKLAKAQTDFETVRDRHSIFYCDFVSRQAAELKAEHQKRALEAIEGELENAETAWAWAVAQSRFDLLEQAVEGLCQFYVRQRRAQALETLCRQASEALLPVTASANELRVLARILAWQGRFLPGDSDRQLVQLSVDLLDKAAQAGQDVRVEMAFSLCRLGLATPDRDEAVAFCRQSLTLYQALGERRGEAEALEALAWRLSKAGGFDEAEQLAGQSLSIRQALGDQWSIAYSLAQLAEFAWQQGHLEESGRLEQQSLTLAQELGDQQAIAERLCDLGSAKVANGNFVEAQPLMLESLQIACHLGNRYEIAFVRQLLACTKMHSGQYQQVREDFEAALAIYQELNYQDGQALCMENLGRVALLEKKYDEGLKLIRKSLAIFRETCNQLMIGFNLASLIYTERMAGELSEARQHLIEALQFVSGMGTFLPLLDTLSAASLLFAGLGQPEQAVEIYALASSYPFIGNSQWNADVVGREIEAIAASLPPEIISAAEERGRARDLWETAAQLLAEIEGHNKNISS